MTGAATAANGEWIRRRRWYALLLFSTLLSVGFRAAIVTSHDGRVPFLSANDRSRWAATAALLEHGTFEIDEVIRRKGWDTIDKVSHYGRDGKQHYYSSKPPILSVLLAVPTWLVQSITETTLVQRPFLVGRIVIGLVGCSLMALLWWLTVLSVERWGTTEFGRVFVVACATWGTLLTSFAVTINNHLPGAVATFIGFYALLRIWYDEDQRPVMYGLAGFGAVGAWACELPALAFLVGLLGSLLLRSPGQCLRYALPPVILVGAAYLGLNFAAHQSWKPPYAHRVAGDDWRGDNWYNYPKSYWLPENRKGVDLGEPNVGRYAFHVLIGHHGIISLTPIWFLSVGGTLLLAREKKYAMVLAVAGLAAICLVFFITRPIGDRNYGGVCCGFRWVLWLAPLWLVAMIPAADRIGMTRLGRATAIGLFVISAGSAAYACLNPFSHPWIFELAR